MPFDLFSKVIAIDTAQQIMFFTYCEEALFINGAVC